jgi:hypothetical protein
VDEFLDGLSALVHDVLKRLKVGQTGTIQCSKEYPTEEVRLYALAYAMHKRKWFTIKEDKASNAIVATRTELPDWEVTEEDDKEEEL